MKLLKYALIASLFIGSASLAADASDVCSENPNSCWANLVMADRYGLPVKDEDVLYRAEAMAMVEIPDFPIYLEPYLNKFESEYDDGHNMYGTYMSTRFQNCVVSAGVAGQIYTVCNDMNYSGEEKIYVIYRPVDAPIHPNLIEEAKEDMEFIKKASKLRTIQDDDGCKVVEKSIRTGVEILDCGGVKYANIPLDKWLPEY